MFFYSIKIIIHSLLHTPQLDRFLQDCQESLLLRNKALSEAWTG